MIADSFFMECLFNDYRRFQMINNVLKDEHNLAIMDIDDILDESFRIIHTIKGTLGFLKLNEAMKKIHDAESKYLKMIKSPPSKDEIYYINVQIETLLHQIVKPFENSNHQLIAIKELFDTIKKEFDLINQKQHKKIKIMIICNEGRIGQKIASDVYKIVYQILKNAIAHSYFYQQMTIKMNITLTEARLKIKIVNDGLNIDFPSLIKKAHQKDKNIDSLEDVLFLNQISSMRDRTELAGSGIGLNCVKQILHQYQGKISVINQEDNTGFFVDLPLKQTFDFSNQQ